MVAPSHRVWALATGVAVLVVALSSAGVPAGGRRAVDRRVPSKAQARPPRLSSQAGASAACAGATTATRRRRVDGECRNAECRARRRRPPRGSARRQACASAATATRRRRADSKRREPSTAQARPVRLSSSVETPDRERDEWLWWS